MPCIIRIESFFFINYGMTPNDFKEIFINMVSNFSSLPPIPETKKERKNHFAEVVYVTEKPLAYSTITSKID